MVSYYSWNHGDNPPKSMCVACEEEWVAGAGADRVYIVIRPTMPLDGSIWRRS